MSKVMQEETKEMHKTKKAIKVSVQTEVQKLKDLGANTNFEFQRINSLLGKIEACLGHMMEDQMLNQLITEQDLIDRKQMGLFG